MPYMPYIIRPTEHVLSTDYPDFNLSFQYAGWPTKNMKIRQKSLQNRWGYSEYRDIGFEILDIALFETTAGSRYTLVLTETDLIKIETASGKTWSFQTPEYTTGTVTEITAEGVVAGNGTTWSTNLAAGDKFILDDDYGAGTLYADLYYTMAGANTTDSICMEVYVMAVTEADAADMTTDSYDTVNYSSEVCNDTAGYLNKLTITLTNADSAAAGDYIRIKIARDANGTNGTDDAVGDLEICRVVIRE